MSESKVKTPQIAAVLPLALLALVLLMVSAVPALAVEEGEGGEEVDVEVLPPDIEELCIEGTIAHEFCPETYEQPSWFQWLLFPLLGGGLLIVTVLITAYLVWQPRFARERDRDKVS